MLMETKQELEKSQERLKNWMALVNTQKEGYDRGNHIEQLILMDLKLLKDELDELKSVCEEYIAM